MKIKFWGVRGSLPASLSPEQWKTHFNQLMHAFFQRGYKNESQVDEFVNKQDVTAVGGYGTSTTCVEISNGDLQIIIDGGSGIKALGDHMMKGPAGKGQGKVHIFLTHFHWDHLLGLPFFTPHFIQGNEIHYYAVQPETEEVVKRQFCKPNFPVTFESLSAKIFFHKLEPRKPIEVNKFRITPYLLDHPDPCWGYRIENGQKVYAHCVDTECTRSSAEALGPDLPLYQKADLMYFDAQYTLPELAEKANWGHSASQLGLEIAMREGIKKVIFAHHDLGAAQEQMEKLKADTKQYLDNAVVNSHGRAPQWMFAYDGLVIDL